MRSLRLGRHAALLSVAFGAALLMGCNSAEERAQGYYDRGLQLVEEGEPVKAALEFRNALRLDENLVPAMYGLAQIEQQQGNIDPAARLLAGIVEREPEHLEARIDLARLYLLANQLDRALGLADEAYALAPEDVRVLTLKGAVALRLDNRFDAVRFAEAALAVKPGNIDALTIRAAERVVASDLTGALSYLDAAGEAGETNIALQAFRIAVLEALGDREGVERVFLRLTELYPRNAAVWQSLARWYAAAGRNDDAIGALRAFADQNRDDVQAALALVAFIRATQGSQAAKAELGSLIEHGGNVFPLQLSLAEVMFADGEQVEAIELLRSQIESASNVDQRSSARVQLARMMGARNDYGSARELVDQVLAEDAGDVAALTVRASISLVQGSVAAAIDDLQAALNEAPQSSTVLQLLAEAYERSGSVALAEEQLVKAFAAAPRSIDLGLRFVEFLLRYGKADQAERVLTEMRSNGTADARVLTRLADLRLRRQDWVGAQEIATAMRRADGGAEADNDAITADRILAAALGGQQKYDESIELLQSTVSRMPGAISPLAELIQAYVRAGKLETAETYLTSMIQTNPDSVSARVLLGSVYTVAQRIDEAEASYRAAIDADPLAVDGHRALTDLYMRSGRFDDAATVVRAGLERQPDNPVLSLQLALILEQQSKFDDAIAVYETMFEHDPRSTVIANNLASLLSEHRNDQASLDRAFEIASRFRNSEIPHFLDTLGWIYHLRGDHAQAVTLLKTAADQLADVGVVQYHMGMAYREMGQTELAVARLTKAVELAGSEPSDQRDRAVEALAALTAPRETPN